MVRLGIHTGMEIDAEPEALVSNGGLDEVIADGVPRSMDPTSTVWVLLLRIESVLEEVDTRMRDGDETSWWQLTNARPSLAALTQDRQVILTSTKRCDNGHTRYTGSVPRLNAGTVMWEG